DSTQYAFSAKYGNWELSADRANASRREFLADGLPAERIERVAGVADTEPHNRRISVVLLRENANKVAGAATPAGGVASASASAAAPAAAPPTSPPASASSPPPP